MNRAVALLVVCLLVLPAGAQYSPGRQPQVPCSPPPRGVDPAVPMNQPDRFAWELFTEVNVKAPAAYQQTINDGGKTFTTNSAVWETWPDDPWTFPENPDPANPPKWPDAPYAKRLHAKGKGNRITHSAHQAPGFVLDTGGEEVHRNRATFEYVVHNSLWYTQGVAAFVAKGAPVNFPTDSLEVKGNWIAIKESDKGKYHWNYDEQGKLWGLVSMHVTSKALPNWFWATFESVYNPGRCDFIGCADCFGTVPAFVKSNDCPTNNQACPSTLIGQLYPAGTITPALEALFQNRGYSGDWLSQYRNYRLKGSQTNFTTSTGQPVLVGNSVTESSFLQTASCITCHSRAAVDAAGKSAFPFFGEAQPLPLQNAIPANANNNFQTQDTTFNGAPNPSWFTTYTSNGPVNIYTQMDFVWAIPFQANPASAPKGK